MGAENTFTNAQFLTVNAVNNKSDLKKNIATKNGEIVTSFNKSDTFSNLALSLFGEKDINNNNQHNESTDIAIKNDKSNEFKNDLFNRQINHSIVKSSEIQSMDEEWHQKYAFIIGLLRKPHCVLLKESLNREQDKLTQKLNAYILERNLVLETINKKRQQNNNNGPEANSDDAISSLSSQMKHLDMMCVTLERQIDVLRNVEQAIPATNDNIYSGEPDSLDGTSSEIIMNDELNSTLKGGHQSDGQISNFQITINGRSPLDVLAMLHLERCAHQETRKELNQLRKKYEVLRDEFDSGEGMSQSSSLIFSCMNEEMGNNENFGDNLANNNDERCTTLLSMGTEAEEESGNPKLIEEVRLKGLTITQLTSRLLPLEKSRIDKVPTDAANEIARLNSTLVQLERVRDELTLQNFTLKSKLAELSARISDSTTYRLEKPTNNNNIGHVITSSSDDANNEFIKNNLNNGDNNDDRTHANALDTSNRNLTMSVTSDDMRLRRKSTYKVEHNNNLDTITEIKQLQALVNDLHTKELEMQFRTTQLETELTNIRNQLADERVSRVEAEKSVLSLEDQLEMSQRRMEMIEQCFLAREEECTALKLDVDTLNEENKRLKDDLNILLLKIEKEQSKSLEKFSKFEKEIGSILEQNKVLQEDFNRERVLRKKYYNMVEELKGKIRVFCRIRPPNKTEKNNEIVAKCSDPYTVTIDTPKGQKEFQFDHVFMPEESQEQIFADTKNLIQSAFDGYSVSICGYGQTGSGKTYTILGNDENPGIAPRTFCEIFSLANEMSQTYETVVSFYILELYNDKLIDLLNPVAINNNSALSTENQEPSKLEIRRDRRGTVWVSGARILPAENSSNLEKAFRQAINGRHTANTKMNDKSSRSHLIIGLIIETTSKVNGTVLRGKISLLDLAGSERIGKSGSKYEQIREANAINKSLSAFGDVINALTTDQSFVPYRNNKLTLLMQDSIGGNAKTLMFVNISPSSFNLEETIVSLTFAARVKQVTNGATRNSDTKELARLKQIIAKLRKGESLSAEDDTL